MISITIKHNLKEIIRMVENLRKRFSNIGRASRIMAGILERQHREYFEAGGHQGVGGPSWKPTDAWWVAHMMGNTSKPMVWTGHAKEALRARVMNGRILLELPEYMRKFQFGPWKFKETFPVVYRGGEWLKIDEDYHGPADGYKSKKIKIHNRHIVDVYPRDVDELMNRMWEEAFG